MLSTYICGIGSDGRPFSGYGYSAGRQTFFSGIGSNGRPFSGYGYSAGNR